MEALDLSATNVFIDRHIENCYSFHYMNPVQIQYICNIHFLRIFEPLFHWQLEFANIKLRFLWYRAFSISSLLWPQHAWAYALYSITEFSGFIWCVIQAIAKDKIWLYLTPKKKHLKINVVVYMLHSTQIKRLLSKVNHFQF